jgi:hypothetical protein
MTQAHYEIAPGDLGKKRFTFSMFCSLFLSVVPPEHCTSCYILGKPWCSSMGRDALRPDIRPNSRLCTISSGHIPFTLYHESPQVLYTESVLAVSRIFRFSDKSCESALFFSQLANFVALFLFSGKTTTRPHQAQSRTPPQVSAFISLHYGTVTFPLSIYTQN